MRRCIAVLMTVMIIVIGVQVSVEAADIPLRVVVDNDEVSFPDAQPFVDNNYRTQTPARFIGEALGATVSWDKTLQQAKFVKDGQVLLINIGSKTYQLNGRDLTMDTVALIKNDRTFVPARYVAEAFGAEVSWDGAVKTVYIKSDSTTDITTGTGDIEYYDGVAFDPVEDLDIYGRLDEDKTIEFYEMFLYNFRYIEVDGIYYVDGEYPTLPEGFTIRVIMKVLKPDSAPTTYFSGIIGNKTLMLPEEGMFRKELINQNLSENDGYEIKLYLYNAEYNTSGLLYIKSPNSVNSEYSAEYQSLNMSRKELIEGINFNKIFQF